MGEGEQTYQGDTLGQIPHYTVWLFHLCDRVHSTEDLVGGRSQPHPLGVVWDVPVTVY